MTGVFHEVLELPPEVNIVAELPYPLLCPEMTNTEIDIPIWKVLLGLPAQKRKPPVEILIVCLIIFFITST